MAELSGGRSAALRAMRKAARFAGTLALAAIAATVAGCNEEMGPLHRAAATGDIEAVKAWIAGGRNLDATYDEPSTTLEGNYARQQGVTALMIAAGMGRIEIARLLVEGGANLYAESRWRDGSNTRNAFDHAAEYAANTRRIGALAYLWEKSDGTRFARRLDRHIAAICQRACDDRFGGDARSNPALFLIGVARDEAALGKGIGEAACRSRQPLRLLAFLDRHAVRFPGSTLHCAAYDPTARFVRTLDERMAMASFFLDHGADINDPGAGFTPLMGAAHAQDIEMVKFLLARGANPNTRNAAGVTAIGVAANTCVYGDKVAEADLRMKPQLAVIELLARSGADTAMYASASARSQLPILAKCCSRTPHSDTQRRICNMFGL